MASIISTKRARKVLSIKEKVELINEHKKGLVTVRNLSKKYGIGQQTVYDLLKKKDNILRFFAESESIKSLAKRKTLKSAENPMVDNATYEWFRQERFKGTPISGQMVIEKAKYFHSKICSESKCEYSQGWLGKFKNRHGIHSLKASGEKQSADYESAVLFVEELNLLIKKESLTNEQIYSADETGLFWKCLPKSTLACNDEYSVEGIKESKERVTVLVCSNASGTHKCELMVIGKSARPRAFKNIRELPVIYKSNKRAWVTQQIFLEWFNQNFVPEARKHCEKIGLEKDCKILLLIDNCPAHPDVDEFKKNNVLVKYLPANCTSLIQRMDQGVIRSLKCHYRKQIVEKLINSGSNSLFLKSFNIKNAIWCVFQAWNAVTPIILRNAWHNILCPEDEEEGTYVHLILRFFITSNLNLLTVLTDEINEVIISTTENQGNYFIDRDRISDWVDCDVNAPTFATLTEDEIVEIITHSKVHESVNVSGSEDSDEEDDMQPKVKITDAITACETLTDFLENFNSEFISKQDMMQIYRIRENLIKEKNKSRVEKQLKIDQFFEHQ